MNEATNKNIYNKLVSSTTTSSVLSILAIAFAITAIAAPFSKAHADSLRYSGNQISWPQITGASAIVYDPVLSETLYEKDADAVRPLASLSKLMTAAVVDDMISNNPNLANKPITIKNLVASADTDVADRQLIAGSKWLPADLIKYMLIGSSNNAAENLASNIIPRASFMSLMNFKAKAWNLPNTTFANPSGLTIVSTVRLANGRATTTLTSGGQSTARQAANLLWDILQNHESLLDITRSATGTFASKNSSVTVANTDLLVASSTLPIIAGKTGYTDEAGGNLAVVIQPNVTSHPHVIVVLGSTQEERFDDVAKLATSTPYITTTN